MSEQGADVLFRVENQTLLASYSPGGDSVSVDEAWLRAQVEAHGAKSWRYSPEAAAEILNKHAQGVAFVDLPIAKACDAQMQVTLSADAFEARLDLTPAYGGEPIRMGQVLAALQERGVQSGILSDAIQEAIEAGAAQGVLIARGQAAVDGHDGWLECLIPTARHRVPKVDAQGNADYRDLGEILVVHAGDVLMRRHPASKGVPGQTLFGAVLPAKDGKEVQFASGLVGVTLAADDPNLLLAAQNGQPVQVTGGMQVDPVFTVESVNPASGHIRFEGCVIVKGDVMAGMTVQASGDIEVGGVVEAATLEAGGNIVIKGGVIGGLGHHDSHFLRCGGTFNAGYASQAHIEAGDSIFIDDTAMQCELSAVNCVRIGGKKSGQLIGGHTQAMFSIAAKKIGSLQRVATRIEIGVNPVMHKQLQDTIKSREARETQLFELSKIIDFARKNPGKVQVEAVEKARKAASALAAAIAQIREEQTTLEAQIELSRQSRVIAEQTLFEGVEVLLGGQHYKAVGEHSACALGLNEEGVLGLISLAEISGEQLVR